MINMNRGDAGGRKYYLVEVGDYYINGPHGLNLTGSARSRVHSLEETFHARMWEGCDDEH